MIVAGRPNKPQPAPIDRIHRAYRDDVIEFADSYGFKRNEIAEYFEQFMLIRMFHAQWPKNLAAWMAMRDVLACFWTPGAEEAN